jgi:hypothetical protein
MQAFGLPSPGELDLAVIGTRIRLMPLNDCTLDEDWYIEVFMGVLMETVRSYEELKDGLACQRLGRLAWASRNLLELKVWSWYVTAARENARRLYDDRFVDAADLMRRFDGLFAAFPNLEAFVPSYQVFREKVTNARQQCGLADQNSYLKVSKVAKEVGLDTEFSALNTVLSKLVHPTAFSLYAVVTGDALASNCQLMYGLGAWYCRDVLVRIDSHLKGSGLPSILP